MTPLVASITFIFISVTITTLKQLIFDENISTQQNNSLSLAHLYTITQKVPQTPVKIYKSFFESYLQREIGSKKVRIKKGTYQTQGLKSAAQNNYQLVNCGDKYLIELSTGIHLNDWVTKIMVYTLPYMYPQQQQLLKGRFQSQLKSQCLTNASDPSQYFILIAHQQTETWTISKIKVSSKKNKKKIISKKSIILGIKSKISALNFYQNTYTYVTEDKPWIIWLFRQGKDESLNYINILTNGPSLYSSNGQYKATTHKNFLKLEKYLNKKNHNSHMKLLKKYNRSSIILPHQLILTRSHVYYIYQQLNHPQCLYNILIESSWEIQEEFQNTGAQIIGSTIDQTLRYVSNCQTIPQLLQLRCTYIIPGNYFLNIVTVGMETNKLTLGKYNQLFKKSKIIKYLKKNNLSGYKDISNIIDNSYLIQNRSLSINGIKFYNITQQYQHHQFNLPSKARISDKAYIYTLSIKTDENLNPIIFINSIAHNDMNYVFTVEMAKQKPLTYNFFLIDGIISKKIKENSEDNFKESLLFWKIQERILQWAYIDSKIIIFWGWGIQIYQIGQNILNFNSLDYGFHFQYILPLIQLFATVYCMFQAIITSSN